MLGSRWLDSVAIREAKLWFFLTAELENPDPMSETTSIDWWGAYGNEIELGEVIGSENDDADKAVRKLLAEIRRCRKENITLITFEPDVPAKLRSVMLCRDIKTGSLRGLRHVSVRELLKSHFYGFDRSLEEISGALEIETEGKEEPAGRREKDVALLWRVLQAVAPMLPEKSMKGRQL